MPAAIPINPTSAPTWLRYSPSYVYSSPPIPTRLEACQEKLIAVIEQSRQLSLSIHKDSFTPERRKEMCEIYETLTQYQERLIELKKSDPEQMVHDLKWITLGVSAVITAAIEYKLATFLASLFSTWPTLLLSGLMAIMVVSSDFPELQEGNPEQIPHNLKSSTLVKAAIAGTITYKLAPTIVNLFNQRTWSALLLSSLMGLKGAYSGTQPLNELIFTVMWINESSGGLEIVGIESDLTNVERMLEAASRNLN